MIIRCNQALGNEIKSRRVLAGSLIEFREAGNEFSVVGRQFVLGD